MPEGHGALQVVPAEPPSTEVGRPHRPCPLAGHAEENKAESLWTKLLTSFFLFSSKVTRVSVIVDQSVQCSYSGAHLFVHSV